MTAEELFKVRGSADELKKALITVKAAKAVYDNAMKFVTKVEPVMTEAAQILGEFKESAEANFDEFLEVRAQHEWSQHNLKAVQTSTASGRLGASVNSSVLTGAVINLQSAIDSFRSKIDDFSSFASH